MRRPHRRLSLPVKVFACLLVVGIVGWRVHGAWQDQKDADLIAAIKQYDAGTVEILLEKGADPNSRDVHPWGGTPVLAVALKTTNCKQCKSMLLALIKHGADPNVKGHGMTFLQLACFHNDNALVALTLEHGAKVNAQDEIGRTALMRATHYGDDWQGDAQMLQALLAHGANVNLKDKYGETALLCALGDSPSSVATVQLLLEHGADVNVKATNGATPLTQAVYLKRSDLVSLLKRYGAKK